MVKGRNLSEVANKPEGFSKELKGMWWNLVGQCTQKDPKDRPTMASVVSKLYDILKAIKGTYYNLNIH